MPLLLLLAGAAALPLVGVAVDNVTQKTPTPPAGGINNGIGDAVKWALLIGGTIVVIKYGSKLVNKI